MSEELETLLHERADRVAFDPVDLSSITRAGRRQVRRRWGAASLGTAAVLAVAVTGAGALGHDGAHRASDPGPTQAYDGPRAAISWATGTTIHDGTRSIDVGHPVRAYVRTSAGFVFTDGSGSVYSAVQGQVTRVGEISADHPVLVGDPAGPRAGWVDPGGARPVFEVLHQSSGEVTQYDAAPGTNDGDNDRQQNARFYAIDGDTAYWHDAGGTEVTDLGPGGTTTALPGDYSILDVRNLVMVASVDDGDSSSVAVIKDGNRLTLKDAYGGAAYVSPDGDWVATDDDVPKVYDTATGAPVTFDIHGYYFADALGWLDDHTVVVFAEKSAQTDFQLLTCSVPQGECQVAVADLGSTADEPPAFELPIGVPLPED